MMYVNGQAVAPVMNADFDKQLKKLAKRSPVCISNFGCQGQASFDNITIAVHPVTGFEGCCFSLINYGLENGKTYQVSFKFKNHIDNFQNQYNFGFTLGNNSHRGQSQSTYEVVPEDDTLINLTKESLVETEYTAQFTCGSAEIGYLTFYLADANSNGPIYITDFKISEVTV